jgi:glycosyltransferase involved in cell wall biosynthesis
MRRVLVASTFLPPHVGGVEHFVDWMKRALPEEGWEVVTAGCRGEGDLIWPCPRWQPANIPIARPSRRALSRLIKAVADSDAMLIQNFFYPFSNWAVVAGRRAHRPMRTVVHGNALFPAGAGTVMRAASVAQAKSIGRWHLNSAPPIAISKSSAAHVWHDFGIQAPVLPLPLPESLVPATDVHLGSDEPFRVVFAGRLVDLKDPMTALRAVMKMAEKRSVRFDVIGDGPLRASLQAVAPSWVTFRGMCSREVTVDAIRTAHCFVSSSTTDNAQTALLEALCMGVPAVATDVGEAGAYLSGTLRRSVVPAGNATGLGTAMADVASNWEQARESALARGAHLRDIHSSKVVARALSGMLDEMSVSK